MRMFSFLTPEEKRVMQSQRKEGMNGSCVLNLVARKDHCNDFKQWDGRHYNRGPSGSIFDFFFKS